MIAYAVVTCLHLGWASGWAGLIWLQLHHEFIPLGFGPEWQNLFLELDSNLCLAFIGCLARLVSERVWYGYKIKVVLQQMQKKNSQQEQETRGRHIKPECLKPIYDWAQLHKKRKPDIFGSHTSGAGVNSLTKPKWAANKPKRTKHNPRCRRQMTA